MRKQYKILRMPIEAKEGFGRKQKAIEETIRKITKKPTLKIPLTDIMRYFAQKPSFVYDEEVISYFLKRKNKNKGGFETLV